jgi:hypothetical protein
MRRRYRPLFAQQELGEIETVAPLMHFDARTIATLKRWSILVNDKRQEIDHEGADLTKVYLEVYQLGAARIKAETRLLGADYDRYQELVAAFKGGLLEQALHPNPKGPGVVISSDDHYRPHAPPDTSKYDGLFK